MKKILVCTTERTGSTFLAKAMERGGLGKPTEFFNDRVVMEIAGSLGCSLEDSNEESIKGKRGSDRTFFARP